MERNQETLETWSKLAETYQKKFMHLSMYDESYDTFLKFLAPEQTRILDIGCGPGNISNYLLRKRPELSVFGIDTAPDMVKLAKKNNPAATFEVLDARDIHTLKTKFDAIVAGFCLPYLSEQEVETLIKDGAHLLTDEGLLYLSFVEGPAESSGFQTGSSGNRVYFNYHDLKKIKQELTASHFQEPTLLRVDFPLPNNQTQIHTILITRKII